MRQPQLLVPKVVGHRGAAGHAPENTLAGFRIAKALGVSWVEFDVHLTADGRCVVLHDDLIDRTTDGQGAVGDMVLEEIASYDAGAWFDPRFAGETIPTLEEVIDLLADLGLGANVELKPTPGVEDDTAIATMELLRSAWPDHLPPPLVSSFDYRSLEVARDVAPEIARGLLLETVTDEWRGMVEAIEATTLHCGHTPLTPARAREIRAAGYPLFCYTVNHAGRAQELFGWGVSGVFTDVPDQVLPLV
ncbi:MAG TPA: glycerophosphodiester phosphodiesterase [Aliidongia sp.]|uniref:glycerophosphodiester phosphodiesterase n=1 Tax=Aliidongia sp. TaxID=1914230 RepID=UPI002DDCB79E|nr:glycerophosphodiester phosphodiesterase [Aliidongia sp.]HEV2673951.1 glycerophosphodiester phosphodiesterase [Aliidongia sp.]